MKPVKTPFSGKGGAHYCAAMEHNGLLYVSGQLSVDPETGRVPEGGIRPETARALENLRLVLQAAGAGVNDVIQCRIYTPDVAYWPEINAVYAAFFGGHMPARVIVPTTELHHGCLVEIEALAAVPERKQEQENV